MDEFKSHMVSEVTGCLCRHCRSNGNNPNGRKVIAEWKRKTRRIVRSALKRELRNEVVNAAE